MSTPEPPIDAQLRQGVSLDLLAEAYAQAMGDPPSSAARAAVSIGAPENSALPGRDSAEERAAAVNAKERRSSKQKRGPQAKATGDRAAPVTMPAPATDFPLVTFQANLAPPGDASGATEDTEIDDADDICPISPLSILEAMLFVGDRSGEALPPARAAEVMRGVEAGDIPALVAELNRRYAEQRRPFLVIHEGPGYRMTLQPEYHPLRAQFYGKLREARLSQAAIDVLAIVAYEQPVVGDEVSRMRGKPSGHVLAQLVRRQLLRVEREAEGPRTIRYLTTERFLSLFQLESLADLPRD